MLLYLIYHGSEEDGSKEYVQVCFNQHEAELQVNTYTIFNEKRGFERLDYDVVRLELDEQNYIKAVLVPDEDLPQGDAYKISPLLTDTEYYCRTFANILFGQDSEEKNEEPRK